MSGQVIEASRRLHVGEFAQLRPLGVDDAGTTLRWRLGDRAVLLNRGAETVDDQRAWILGRPSNELNFVIETVSAIPVGTLSLIEVDLVHRRAESARFLIGEEEPVRGLPVAVEAMKLLYHVAFDQLGLQRVYGAVVAENVRMLKWQTYLGMKEEGRLRRHAFLDGRFHDMVTVGILEEDFRGIALPRMRDMIALAARRIAQPDGRTDEPDRNGGSADSERLEQSERGTRS